MAFVRARQRSRFVLSTEERYFFGFEWKGGTRKLILYLRCKEWPLSWRAEKCSGFFEIPSYVLDFQGVSQVFSG